MSADRVSNPNLSCCWVCGADAEEYEGAKGTEYEGLFKVGCAAGNTDHDDEYPEGCAEEPETIWYPTAARAREVWNILAIPDEGAGAGSQGMATRHPPDKDQGHLGGLLGDRDQDPRPGEQLGDPPLRHFIPPHPGTQRGGPEPPDRGALPRPSQADHRKVPASAGPQEVVPVREGLSKPPVQVRAYEKIKKHFGGRDGRGETPEDRYTLRILETRANASAGRQAKRQKRALDPKGPEKEALKDLVHELDRQFSRFVRGRDTKECEDGARRGHCVTCGSYHTYAELECSHWIPRLQGGKKTTRWHEWNAHAACSHCNKWKGGATLKHEEAIKRLHGENAPDQIRAKHKFGQAPERLQMEKMIEDFKTRADALGAPA